METELQELLQRGVAALERLAEDPVIQMETGPPVCPHCKKVNPIVRVSESEAHGPMAEIVYRLFCLNCNDTFYGIPIQWDTVRTLEEIQRAVAERQELGGYGNNG